MKHHGLVCVDWGRKGLAKRVLTLPLGPMVQGLWEVEKKLERAVGKSHHLRRTKFPPRKQVRDCQKMRLRIYRGFVSDEP